MKKKIGIIGFKNIGGGSIVILEYASRIFHRGNFEVFLIIKDDFQNSDFDWFSGADVIPKLSYEEARAVSFDAVIGTAWQSCYDLSAFDAKTYIYFNQSVESRFYDSKKKNYINFADGTYLLDLNIITEAHWIKEYIEDNYGKNAVLVRNGINKNNFTTEGRALEARDNDKVIILVEGPVERDFKNVLKSIDIARRSKCDEIWLLTSSDVDNLDGVDRIFSKIPYNLTAEIYRSCDILLKLSTVEGMFGPPLEIFHCGGTAVTYDVSGHDEYMIHNYNSKIAGIDDDEAILNHINSLIDDKTELQRFKTNALKTAHSWPDWDEAVANFEMAIEKAIENPSTNRKMLQNKIEILTYFFEQNINQRNEIEKISKYRGYKLHYNIRSFFGLNN